MKRAFRSLSLIGAIALASASFGDCWLYTNIRTITDQSDTHQYQGPISGVDSLLGSSTSTSPNQTASESVSATFGDFKVSASTDAANDPSEHGYAVVSHDGNPTLRFHDTLTVTGGAGGVGTFSADLALLGVTVNSGHYGTLQGFDAFLQTDQNNRVEVKFLYDPVSGKWDVTGPKTLTFSGAVGSQVNLDGYLYADTASFVRDFPSGHDSSSISGEMSVSLSGQTPSDQFTSCSGAHYAAVPEPAPFALLGLGLLGFWRRRAVSAKTSRTP